MAILVTGATGNVGSLVTRHLTDRNADVRVMTRRPDDVDTSTGVVPVHGHFDDPATLRAALRGVDTLFLLNATVAEELTQAVTILNLAADAGIRQLVYLSVLGTEYLGSTPHVAAKIAVERLIAEYGFLATIVRATLFMQNDYGVVDVIRGAGVYPWPIGDKGVAVVDVRDVADAAARAVLRREGESRLPNSDAVTVCGPEALTGEHAAEIWARSLGRDVVAGGTDLDQFEETTLGFGMPAWYAYDLRQMFAGMQAHGQSEDGAVDRLTEYLGRAPRSYADFTTELAASWT